MYGTPNAGISLGVAAAGLASASRPLKDAYAQLGQYAEAASPVAPTPELTAVIDRLQSLRQTVGALRDRLDTIEARVFGPRSTASSCDKSPSAEVNCILGMIHQTIDAINREVHAAHEAAERLSTL